MRLKQAIYESTRAPLRGLPSPWGRQIGGGFAEIDDEVAAVLAFVLSHKTFLAAQDDETGRCAPSFTNDQGMPKGSPFISLPICAMLYETANRSLSTISKKRGLSHDICR